MRMLMVVLLAGGCMTPMAGEVPLADTSWRVVELHGSPASGPRVRFTAGGEVDANGGCNQIGGRYESNGSSLRVDGVLMMTRRACAEAEKNAIESAFVKALEAMRSYAISGRTLTLYSSAGAEIAVLEAASDSR